MSRILKIGLITVTVIAVLAGTIYGSLQLGSHFESKQAKANQACASGQHTEHKVIIQNDVATPSHTNASRCDSLTITNLDAEPKLMAFGLHEEHQPYDGVTEKLLTKGQSLTVTLVQTGNFKFHDHIHDKAQGTFTVTEQ